MKANIKPFFKPLTFEQKRAFENTAPHLLLWGAGYSGKTQVGVHKGIWCAFNYPGSRIVFIRKHKVDLRTSIWLRLIELLPKDKIVKLDQSQMICKLINGSVFWGFGLSDEQEINKLASSECAVVIIEEASETTEDAYDSKIQRSVRQPNIPFHQTILLTNPSHPNHWINKRWRKESREGYDDIKMPTLPREYIPGSWLIWFDSLNGIFGRRYKKGEWAAAEGMVYPYDEDKHFIKAKDEFKIPPEWERVVAIDFGFSLMHAMCVHWWAIAPEKFRKYPKDSWFCYRQIYRTGVTVKNLAPQIKYYMGEDGILRQSIICDHDADGRATLEENELKTIPAKKNRLAGQQVVYDKINEDKVYFFETSLVETDQALKAKKIPTRTEEEFPIYEWPNKLKEDLPNQLDHGVSTMRYAIFTHHKGISSHEVKHELLEPATVDLIGKEII